MLIKMKSQATGVEHTRDIALTEAQYQELNSPTRRLIQDIVPDLSKEDREFMLTGITPEEWAKIFPPEEIDKIIRKPLPEGVKPGEPVNSAGNYYAADGTFMNADGTRSVFDDVDE